VNPPIPTAQRGSEARLLRGYGPLLGMIAAFLAMALLAPTVAPEERVTAAPAGATGTGSGSAGTATGAAAPGATTATGGGTAATPGVAGAPGEVGAPPPDVAACEGPQVANDPYSPVCLTWDGTDNGGATTAGVDAETIRVVLRDPGPPYDIGSVIGQLTGSNPSGVTTTRDSYIRTYETLIEYFNR
jgi:hypothetical protein